MVNIDTEAKYITDCIHRTEDLKIQIVARHMSNLEIDLETKIRIDYILERTAKEVYAILCLMKK